MIKDELDMRNTKITTDAPKYICRKFNTFSSVMIIARCGIKAIVIIIM